MHSTHSIANPFSVQIASVAIARLLISDVTIAIQ